MSAYSVGTAYSSGNRTWWVKWEMAHLDMSATHRDIRDATPEEAALMEKVEWHKDTHSDREALHTLLNGSAAAAAL